MTVMIALAIGICIGMWGPKLVARILVLGEAREPDYPVKARVKLKDLLEERRPNTVGPGPRHRLGSPEKSN